VNIPKQRTIKAISEDGNEYIKVEDIRFPLLSYILSAPIRVFRVIRFQLKIWGVLPIHIDSENDLELDNDQAKQSKEQQLTFGQIKETPIPFNTTIQSQIKSGIFRVRYAYIDQAIADGNDVLEFSWKTEEGDEHKTYHMPDHFLRLMFSEESRIFGRFLSEIGSTEKEAFSTHLLVHEAKALVDDRTYEEIRISDHNYEIRLKYLGLHISLASVPNEPEHLFALMSGVICEGDILESFIVRIPLSNIAASSTAAFDAEEEAWVQI